MYIAVCSVMIFLRRLGIFLCCRYNSAASIGEAFEDVVCVVIKKIVIHFENCKTAPNVVYFILDNFMLTFGICNFQ